MNSWMNNVRRVAVGAAAVVAVAGGLSASVDAAEVRGVTVTKGQDWVRVSVSAPGAEYRVRELPVGSSAYRSLAIDVPNSYISGGLMPKARVPVNEGLVAQVRVKQMRSFVRVYIDVLSFPKYQVGHIDGQLVIGMDTKHMRSGNPIAPQNYW